MGDGRTRAGQEPEFVAVIDHDLLLLDAVSDRTMVFEGDPGTRGAGRAPVPVRDGLNRFLSGIGVTFRTDPETGRPRANKSDCQMDRHQKAAGMYYRSDGAESPDGN